MNKQRVITYKGITQKFRWIEPGEFVMGSLGEETDEKQHEVILTQGYWLADTACTQALWQVVMGDNPSKFKGDERPVETVSWDDVQEFIHRLPNNSFRLPTEAEWEYACRAGTTTAFSFGNTLTPALANYNGNEPYAGGAKGMYRKETVDVKQLHKNSWGLYQMHGNMWEWCSDWCGDYPDDTVTDPTGSEYGDSRVLRGGGWNDDGRDLRAACRARDRPGNRYDDVGFRLVLLPNKT